MALASSRVAKGPICTWSRLSLGSLRTIALYPCFFRADTRTSASSWWDTAAIWTIAGAAACAPCASAVEDEAEAAIAGVTVGDDAVAGVGLGLAGGVASDGSELTCLITP